MSNEIQEYRKLSAIMFTDMVGYSALTQRNESLALELLEEHRKLLRPIFPKYGGQEIKTIGDAFLVEFNSALQAVQCAIEMQKVLKEHNESSPAERKIELRIGIHVGDVVHKENDVYGDGVNIASRIYPLADPGGICITEDVFRQIQNKVEAPMIGMGKGELKNIQLSVAIYKIILPWQKKYLSFYGQLYFTFKQRRTQVYGFVVITVLLVAGYLFISNKVKMPKSEAPENSLAVMYFENIPDSQDKNHISEMLVNLLITSLSQTKDLQVISRERLYDIQREISPSDSKNITPELATKIAKRANVKTMFLGSILQEQPKLVITSRLVNVESGKILGSQKLTEFSSDQIFSLVDSLAFLVKNNLKITAVSVSESKPVAEVTTNSLEAYRSYVQGVELYKKIYFSEAKAALSRAVELDSTFAMAYFLLSEVNRYLKDNTGMKKALEKAWKFSDKIGEKERLQIQAQYARLIDNDPLKAVEISEKFLQKYPHEQNAYIILMIIYRDDLVDFEKALQTQLRGLKDDPLNKNLWNTLAYFYAGFNKRKEALESINKYLELSPGEANPYDSKGDIYYVFGERDSALYWWQKAVSFKTDFSTSKKLGFDAILHQDYLSAEKYFEQLGRGFKDNLLLISIHKGQFKYVQKQFLNNQTKNYLLLALLAYEMKDYSSMLEYAKIQSTELKKNPNDKFYGRDVLAWAYLKNGDSKMCYKIMDEIKNDIKLVSLQRKYDYAMGILFYEEGKYDIALEYFAKAFQRILPNHAPQFYYAISLFKSDRISESIDELQRLIWWPPDIWSELDPFFTASYWPIASVKAHYWLGVAYEQKGEKDKAIMEYEKFLDIWKDADENLPELIDTKTRLGKLKEMTRK